MLRRGFALEYLTLGWNVVGIVVLAIAAITAGSVALAGFGLDSFIEIAASTVVIWELSGTDEKRQRRSLRLIGYAFAALAIYLLIQSTVVLASAWQRQPARPHAALVEGAGQRQAEACQAGGDAGGAVVRAGLGRPGCLDDTEVAHV